MAGTLYKLNARSCETLTKPGRHGDGGGLYLSISPKGSKRWVFLYRWRGKLTELGLGSLDPASSKYRSLATARAEAERLRAIIASGKNPAALRAEEAEKPPIPTFGELAEIVIALRTAKLRNPKHVDQWRMSLGAVPIEMHRVRPELRRETEAHIAALKRLRAKPVDLITTEDVAAVLQPIWQSKHESAVRLRGRIWAVLDTARVRKHRPPGVNPADRSDLGHYLIDPATGPGQPRHRHHKAMPYREVAAFVERLRENGSVSSLALEFTILTAARTGETLGARWSEIDLDEAAWTVPAERMKAGVTHRVPLSARAVAILRALEPLSSSPSDYVFPGLKRAGLSTMALEMVVRRSGLDVTVHGFRASFRTWADEQTNFPHAVCERALAHTKRDQTEAAYNRGELFEKRRALMDAWASYIEPGEATANVVTLRKSAGVSR